jgi:aldehyde dehydrogenase (NAD+)
MPAAQVWVPLVAFPASGQIVPEPLGVILIFSCWNVPLGTYLSPLRFFIPGMFVCKRCKH